jgi:DinB superfamily
MNNISSTVLSETGLMTEQITKASRHLAVTRGFLVESVSGLSAAQWDFKPSHDTWSIAENLEHIVLIEKSIHGIIESMSHAPEAAPEANRTEMDDFILNEIPKRSRKGKSLEHACPTHRWSGPEALQHFIDSREQSNRLLVTRRLRGHVVPHPLFGPWDGYQWLMAAASHGARHTAQICEVKASRSFPQAPSVASNHGLNGGLACAT